MAGLSPEQILGFGQLDQGQQQLRNQSSQVISDAIYRMAQSRLAGTKANIKQQLADVEAEYKQAMAQGKLVDAMLAQQKFQMLSQGVHPTQTGTDAARQAAVTGSQRERRQAAEYLLAEERFAFEKEHEQNVLDLEALKTANQIERDEGLKAKRQAEIDAIETKIDGTVADTVVAIDENKGNEIVAKGLIDFYNETARDHVTTLYWYNPDDPGWDSSGAEPIELEDEEGNIITMGQIREIAEDNNVSPVVIINALQGQVEE